MRLNELKSPEGSVKQRKRVGRGIGSGTGKTSGRGHKGQKARSGASTRRGFEGGQMPLQRRLPKRGFTNIFKKQYALVNVGDLNIFADGSNIDIDDLQAAGLIKSVKDGVKLLGNGELEKQISITVHCHSRQAEEKVIAKGGKIEVI